MKQDGGRKGVGLGLEFLSEPALITGFAGDIRGTNALARKIVGDAANIFDAVCEDRDTLSEYLRRAGRSTSPHAGSLSLDRDGKVDRFRAMAARLQLGDAPEALLIIRLKQVRDDHFDVLSARVRDLDKKLLARLRENALLQEALDENTVLLRELQHRVKNNIQQMLTLIRMSGANRKTPEVKEVVETASRRLRAMAMTQEATYQNASTTSLMASSFLEDLTRVSAESCGVSDELTVRIEDGRMTSEEARCLALIANELITNACKHGIVDIAGKVDIRFGPVEGGYRFVVRDNGQGFDEGTIGRASGLRLVRSLCRQIGGKLEIERDNGTRCSVEFTSEWK